MKAEYLRLSALFCELACLRLVGITNASGLKRSDSENRASKGELA